MFFPEVGICILIPRKYQFFWRWTRTPVFLTQKIVSRSRVRSGSTNVRYGQYRSINIIEQEYLSHKWSHHWAEPGRPDPMTHIDNRKIITHTVAFWKLYNLENISRTSKIGLFLIFGEFCKIFGSKKIMIILIHLQNRFKPPNFVVTCYLDTKFRVKYRGVRVHPLRIKYFPGTRLQILTSEKKFKTIRDFFLN